MVFETSEPEFEATGTPKLVIAAGILLAVALFGGMAVVFRTISRQESDEWTRRIEASKSQMDSEMFSRPGLSTPKAVSAEESGWSPDDEVIGVTAGTVSRAYPISEMDDPYTQLVNDCLQDTPVSISFCRKTLRVRAFTRPGLKRAVSELWIAGFSSGNLILKLQSLNFPQNTEEKLPLDDYPFVRTTWKKWQSEHPETDAARLIESAKNREMLPQMKEALEKKGS